MILFKIAFRNMREHRAKTLIVGALVTLGAFVLVAGNSFMDSVRAGQRRTFSENFTGDLIVRARSDKAYSLTLSPNRGAAPTLDGFPDIQARVAAREGVAESLPLVNGFATLAVGETTVGFTMLWGVEYERYRSMFPDSVELVEGAWPEEPGATVLISEATRRQAEEEAKRALRVGEKLLLSSMGEGGAKIREVTLAAVFRYRQGNELLDRISLTDPGTLRALNGMTLVRRETPASPVTGESVITAETVDEDALFGSLDLGSVEGAGTAPIAVNYENLLGDTSVRDRYAATDSDAWNFLLVRLADGRDASRDSAALSLDLGAPESGFVVSDWRWGAGVQAELSYYLQLAFNIIVFIVVVVAVIIIMNTLVISITERIPEIGTMRALGAGKNFVRLMIVSETLMVSFAFGILGMTAGCLAVWALGRAGISSSNEMLQALFGGTVFRPSVSLAAVGNALAVVLAVGIVSCLYPIYIALKITPVRAMQRA